MLIHRRMHCRYLAVASTSKGFSSFAADPPRKLQANVNQKSAYFTRRSDIYKNKRSIAKPSLEECWKPTGKFKKEFYETNPVPNTLSPDKSATFIKIRENLWNYYVTLNDLSVLDHPQLLGEETRDFLYDNAKGAERFPSTLLLHYTLKQKISQPEYFIFQFPHHSTAKRYIAWVQLQDFHAFGTFEKSPQNAKHMAAAYVIDHLVKSGQLKTKREDITEKDFEDANPTPANFLPDQAAKFVEKRKEIWKLYTSGSLSHPQPLGEETRSLLQAEADKGIKVFEMLDNYAIRHNISKPDYYIFRMPHHPLSRRNIAWVHLQDFDAFVTFVRAYPSAKLTAAEYVIDRLVKSGQLKCKVERGKDMEHDSSIVHTSSTNEPISELNTGKFNPIACLVKLQSCLDKAINPMMPTNSNETVIEHPVKVVQLKTQWEDIIEDQLVKKQKSLDPKPLVSHMVEDTSNNEPIEKPKVPFELLYKKRVKVDLHTAFDVELRYSYEYKHSLVVNYGGILFLKMEDVQRLLERLPQAYEAMKNKTDYKAELASKYLESEEESTVLWIGENKKTNRGIHIPRTAIPLLHYTLVDMIKEYEKLTTEASIDVTLSPNTFQLIENITEDQLAKKPEPRNYKPIVSNVTENTSNNESAEKSLFETRYTKRVKIDRHTAFDVELRYSYEYKHSLIVHHEGILLLKMEDVRLLLERLPQAYEAMKDRSDYKSELTDKYLESDEGGTILWIGGDKAEKKGIHIPCDTIPSFLEALEDVMKEYERLTTEDSNVSSFMLEDIPEDQLAKKPEPTAKYRLKL